MNKIETFLVERNAARERVKLTLSFRNTTWVANVSEYLGNILMFEVIGRGDSVMEAFEEAVYKYDHYATELD